ncbi:MAG: glycosyltransferase family 1 protein [Deltaproteobacteria bacterium]|nr:glycosyltransferase family 1 protein [Deltaproteobacteria bacterium]
MPFNVIVFNQPWFVEELRELGHRVVSVGRFNPKAFDVFLDKVVTPVEDVLLQMPSGFEPDCIVYHDDSWPIAVTGLENLQIPKIFYSVDAHHHWRWHGHFGALFDLVLVALKDYLVKFHPFCPQVEWFPLWAPIEMVPEKEKTIDVCFRGNLNPNLHPLRVEFFEKLQKLITVDVKQGPYTKDFPRSKIVINEAVKDDVNFRIFEAVASSALLITPAIANGLNELFAPGEELVLYEKGNVQDACDKIKYYLEHEEERQRIADSGFRRVQACHSVKKRTEQLAMFMEKITLGQRPTQWFSAAYVYAYAGGMLAKTEEKVCALKVLKAGIASLGASLQQKEQLLDNWQVVAISLAVSMLGLGKIEEALELTSKLHNEFPEDEILTIGLLNVLQKKGDMATAEAVAQEMSSKPAELLQAVPDLINKLMI